MILFIFVFATPRPETVAVISSKDTKKYGLFFGFDKYDCASDIQGNLSENI